MSQTAKIIIQDSALSAAAAELSRKTPSELAHALKLGLSSASRGALQYKAAILAAANHGIEGFAAFVAACHALFPKAARRVPYQVISNNCGRNALNLPFTVKSRKGGEVWEVVARDNAETPKANKGATKYETLVATLISAGFAADTDFSSPDAIRAAVESLRAPVVPVAAPSRRKLKIAA